MRAHEFARWVRDHRKRLKREGRTATQEEIARKAGVGRSTVAMIEALDQPGAQQWEPSREVVEAIARAVGGSISEALVTAGYAPTGMRVPAEEWPPAVVETADRLNRVREQNPEQFERLRLLIETMTPSDRMALAAA